MDVLVGLALAGAAGWNALLPLIVLAMAERLGRRVGLVAPYDLLASTGGIIGLLLLLPVEVFGDKIPGLDARNDRFGLVYRPLAGAVAMAAVTRDTPLPALIAALMGGAVALGMHLLKVWYRHPLAQFKGGVGQSLASFWEDILCATVAVLTFVLPVAGVAMLLLAASLAGWTGAAMRRLLSRTAASRPATLT